MSETTTAPPSGVSPRAKREWTSAGVVYKDGLAHVTYLDLAIYIHALHRLRIVRLPVHAVRLLGPGRHEVVFNDPDEVVSELELEFARGEGQGEGAHWARAVLTAQRDLKAIMRREDARNSQGRTGKSDQPDPAADLPKRRRSR